MHESLEFLAKVCQKNHILKLFSTFFWQKCGSSEKEKGVPSLFLCAKQQQCMCGIHETKKWSN
jgi:hypothetical protein